MRKRPIGLAAFLITTLAIAGSAPNPSEAAERASGAKPADSAYAGWSFHSNFKPGISGWMSFPLAQDVGFDPSIYTAEHDGKYALVRDVIACGQRYLHVGLIRPLSFHATSAAVIELRYSLSLGGLAEGMRLVLAGRDGHRYTVAIPASEGSHEVRIVGSELHLREAGAAIEAVAIEADVSAPVLGSHNRLVVLDFGVQAQRGSPAPLIFPALTADPATGVLVADASATSASELRLRLGKVTSAVRVALYDGNGRIQQTQELEPGQGEYSVPLTASGESVTPGLWTAALTAPDSATTFRFLVLDKAPPHPRVLLSAARLQQLRSQMGSNPLLRIIRLRAPQLAASIAYNPDAGDNIAMLPADTVHTATPAYFSLMESYSNSIVFNALVFRLTGSQQALDAARRGLLTVSKWRTWTPRWFPGLHTYYEVGVFSQRVALAYDLLADQFTPDEKAAVTAAFWKDSIEPTLEDYFLLDRLPIAASNHMANSVGGAIAALVAVYGDAPQWNDRLRTALAELIACYESMLGKGLFPGDGSEAEPAGYDDFAMEGLSSGLAALHSLGIRPRGTRRMMDGFWWPDYAMASPGLVLDTGDFGGELRALPGFAWGAENGDNPYLRAFYARATDPRLAGLSHVEDTGRLLEMAPGQLDLVCCTRPETSPPPPPSSRIFPLRGSAILRSGWSPSDTVISIRAGPWFNHEHHDEGSFQVAAFGERLISEAGYADYYKDPYYQDYFTQAAGHNVVLLDRDPFSQAAYQGTYWSAFDATPHFAGHVLSPAIDYLSADLTAAYDGRLSVYRREYLFLKPDLLIVHDRIESRDAHRFTWLLHIPAGDQPGIQGADATIRGNAAMAILTAAGGQSPWTVHSTPLPISDYTELDRSRVLPEQEFQLDSSPGRSTSFLVSLRLLKSGGARGSIEPAGGTGAEGLRGSLNGAEFDVVFSGRSGMLRAREASADGDALAVVEKPGERDFFASHAKSLSVEGKPWLEMDAPANVTIRRTTSATDVELVNSIATGVRIRCERKPAKITVDRKPINAPLERDFLVLRGLPAGDHAVSISY